jgi:hypothetical protein
MKPTKTIMKLAEQIAPLGNTTVEHATKVLTELKEAMIKGRYYTGVVSVAPSGMSRVIKIGYIKDNKLRIITNPAILRLAGCDKKGRINGCGMDMLFAAQYNLFSVLAPNLRYQDKMKSYHEL